MQARAPILTKTVSAIEGGKAAPHPQAPLAEGVELRHAPKIFKADCEINWEQPVSQVHNLIRGLSPYPTAYTLLDGKTLKIFRASKELATDKMAPGDYQSDGKTYLKYACKDGFILLEEVQLEGKKRMSVGEFLRGYRLGGD